jgi:hypothetical protein
MARRRRTEASKQVGQPAKLSAFAHSVDRLEFFAVDGDDLADASLFGQPQQASVGNIDIVLRAARDDRANSGQRRNVDGDDIERARRYEIEEGTLTGGVQELACITLLVDRLACYAGRGA